MDYQGGSIYSVGMLDVSLGLGKNVDFIWMAWGIHWEVSGELGEMRWLDLNLEQFFVCLGDALPLGFHADADTQMSDDNWRPGPRMQPNKQVGIEGEVGTVGLNGFGSQGKYILIPLFQLCEWVTEGRWYSSLGLEMCNEEGRF